MRARGQIALLLVVLLGACSERHVIARGDIEVELSPHGALQLRRDGAELLRSHRGDPAHGGGDRLRAGAAYAPFAAAVTSARQVEEVFGFFDFYDQVEPFTALTFGDVEARPGELVFSFEQGGEGRVSIEEDGAVRISWRVPSGIGDRLAMSFSCHEGERLFGMGAQVSHEHRGFRVPVWTQEQGIGKAAQGEPPMIFGLTGGHYDSYAPVPFALSTRPLGLWLDTPYRSSFDLCELDDRLRIEAEGGRFDLVLFPAPSMASALARFTARTGRPGDLPRWAFAPWIDAHGGPDAVLESAQLLRARQIPAAAIWAEDWVGTLSALGGEHLSYDWQEDPARYPDLAGLAAALHRQGLRLLTYINPFVPAGADVRAEIEAADALVRDQDGEVMELLFPFGEPPALFDPTAPGAQAVFEHLLSAAVAKGVDGWMADYGEALPVHARMADGRSGAAAHNSYPKLWAEANRGFWERARPDGDFVFFSRSGFTGIAADTAVHWLGDQLTTFDRNDGLGSVVPLYLSAGLSGIALTHSDIGGYTSVGSSVRSYELWARWLALEAFTPFFRTHHSSDPAGNIQWYSDEQTLGLLARYARWHQRLLPYFARAAVEARAAGTPAVRPLWWGNEQLIEDLDVEDAFLSGPDLLVAPIVVEGAAERELTLPPGSWRRWRDLMTPLGADEEGGRRVAVAQEVGEAGVFVRAGAVVPLLAREYDSVAPLRAGEEGAPGLMLAPDPIDELLLLLVAGGVSDGGLSAPGFAAARWSFDGDALESGPLTGVRVDGVLLPSCVGPRERDCVQGGRARLSRGLLDGRELRVEAGEGSAVVRVEGDEMRGVVVELR